MEAITYLFIDGGYLKKAYADSVQEWFGGHGEIDFPQLTKFFQARKIFYYDCEDTIHNPSESKHDYESRLKEQESFFNKIREIPGCHVQLGHLSGSSAKRRRQKEVDIRLTVDMMNHAMRRNMTKAALLTGDRDFKPLVESLVEMSIHVELAADGRSVSQDLAYAADFFRKLTFDTYHSWSTQSLKSAYPINIRSINLPPAHARTLKAVKTGFIGDDPVTLYEVQNSRFCINIPLYKNSHPIALEFDNAERLELYFRLQYGNISWT